MTIPLSSAPHLRLVDPDLTRRAIGCFFRVYNALGPGFLEAVYRRALAMELEAAGLKVESEVKIDVYYREGLVGSFRADLIVEDKLLLEIKSTVALVEAHSSQVLNYLSATSLELGLLLNFGAKRPEIRRFVVSNRDKRRQKRTRG